MIQSDRDEKTTGLYMMNPDTQHQWTGAYFYIMYTNMYNCKHLLVDVWCYKKIAIVVSLSLMSTKEYMYMHVHVHVNAGAVCHTEVVSCPDHTQTTPQKGKSLVAFATFLDSLKIGSENSDYQSDSQKRAGA